VKATGRYFLADGQIRISFMFSQTVFVFAMKISMLYRCQENLDGANVLSRITIKIIIELT
jgi:hypothetical protein